MRGGASLVVRVSRRCMMIIANGSRKLYSLTSESLALLIRLRDRVSPPLVKTFKKVVMSPHTLSSYIDRVIEERSKQVQVIEQYLENLNSIDEAIKELRNVTNNLSQHPYMKKLAYFD